MIVLMRNIEYGTTTPGVNWNLISEVGDHWIWSGKTGHNGRPQRVHRTLLTLATGETRAVARLQCPERLCVNPAHHEWSKTAVPASSPVCSVPDCLDPVDHGGLCASHHTYQRRHNGRLPERVEVSAENLCAVPECDRAKKHRGWCKTHYNVARRGGVPSGKIRGWGARICAHPGCGLQHEAKGFCTGHYQRFVSGRDMDPPLKTWVYAPGEWGDWHADGDGYMRRTRTINGSSERQLEHRWVMEQQIGRPLRPEETVHHINGVRNDNRVENLELWSSSHPSGQRVEDKVEWAKQILELYSDSWQHAHPE